MKKGTIWISLPMTLTVIKRLQNNWHTIGTWLELACFERKQVPSFARCAYVAHIYAKRGPDCAYLS